MISGRIAQTYQGLKACYQILLEGRVCANAEVPYNVNWGRILCGMPDGHTYSLVYDFRKELKNWGKELQRREYLTYQILDENGYEAGHICKKQTKGFFSGYSYHEISLAGRIFNVYCVPWGKDGMKYPMYLCQEGYEEQVGLMEKPCVVEDMLDVYDFRVTEAAYAAPLILYALYIDLVYYGNRGEIPIKSKSVSYEITFNKKLKEKYHPDF